jgi:hypothetical protein
MSKTRFGAAVWKWGQFLPHVSPQPLYGGKFFKRYEGKLCVIPGPQKEAGYFERDDQKYDIDHPGEARVARELMMG